MSEKDISQTQTDEPLSDSADSLLTDSARLTRKRAKAVGIPDNLELLSPDETQLVVRELRLHRIELEIQNERKRAEQALRQSEQNYRELVEHLSEGVGIADPEEVFSLTNPAAERIFGVGSGELVGRTLHDFLSLEGQEQVRFKTTQRAQGYSDAYELEIIRADGERRALLVTAAPRFDANGEFRGTMGIFRDITDRKRSEEEIRSLARFVSENPDAVLRVAQDGILIYVNEQGLSQLPEWHLQVGERVPPVVQDVVRKCLESGSREALDIVYGEQIFSFLAVSVVEAGYANLYGHDVTNRRQSEKALSESEERFQLANRATFNVIWDWNLLNDTLWWNENFQILFGYRAEEIEPGIESRWNRIHVKDRDRVKRRIQAAIVSGQDHWFDEYRFRRKDGKFAAVEDRGYISRDASGQPLRMIGAMQDITERRQAEKALRESEQREFQTKLSEQKRRLELEKKTAQVLSEKAEELAHSNKELEQFAYVASHDLQEPLRMVASYTQLLAERYAGKLDDRADKYIGYAVAGAVRMQTLINDLLALSRVNTRGKPFEETNCTDLMSETIQNLDRAIEESGADIVVGDLPTVMADRTQLGQVFQNLIANAVKFKSDSRPVVEVTAQQNGGNWEFCVADNGIGIDPQFHERVFVIFQRLHERDKYAGNGIGLAICKKIIERHGGHIWIESEIGAGTRFRFVIPISTSQGDARTS